MPARESEELSLSRMLDLHKRLVGVPSVRLRQKNKALVVTSAAPSGLAVRSKIDFDGTDLDITVERAALAAFARGAPSPEMSVRDGRLIVRGKKVRGDIPSQPDEQVAFPAVDGTTVAPVDVAWLRDNLPAVALSDLDQTGLLSAECDREEWRMSCVDDIHGACVFGKGGSRIKFSLVPSDASVLRSLLAAADETQPVTIGQADNLLVVRTKNHVAAIPTVAGEAQTRQSVTGGMRLAAHFAAEDLQESLAVLEPVASVKDAAPVTSKHRGRQVLMSVSSPGRSLASVMPAECVSDAELRASHSLLSSLCAKAHDRVALGLGIGADGKDVARLMLKRGELHLLMLTSP